MDAYRNAKQDEALTVAVLAAFGAIMLVPTVITITGALSLSCGA